MKNDLQDFGRNTFVSWTTGLIERVEEAEREDKMDEEYICLSCDSTYDENDLWLCHKCNEPICPKCGGDISTIEEFDEAMREESRNEN